MLASMAVGSAAGLPLSKKDHGADPGGAHPMPRTRAHRQRRPVDPGTVDTLDDASWERMRSINLDGLIRLARTSVPRLRESRGTFLAISSIAGLGGDWNQAGYNATKGAVNALVQSMALDLGRDGVRVNAIAPAFTATRQTQDRLDDPAFWSALRNRLALERAADPEDVARAALFLASPDAAYITGVVLPVDGGTTASVGTPRPITG